MLLLFLILAYAVSDAATYGVDKEEPAPTEGALKNIRPHDFGLCLV